MPILAIAEKKIRACVVHGLIPVAVRECVLSVLDQREEMGSSHDPCRDALVIVDLPRAYSYALRRGTWYILNLQAYLAAQYAERFS
jgi:hypothetical protein